MIGITGASGFVGKNLVAYLHDRSFDTKLVSRQQLSHPIINLNNLDAVIHLAGKAHDLKKTSDPLEYYQVNFDLTKRIFDSFLNSDAKTFIFISSVKAVADSLLDDKLTEETEPSPQTHYGKSKLQAENYIRSKTMPEGKRYFILRPCMIHGPGNKGNLNLLYNIISKGIPYPLGSYNNQRSFLSVENLCFMIIELLNSDLESGVYNLSDNGSLSTKQVVEYIGSAIGTKPQILNIPKSVINGMAKIGDFLRLPFNSERLLKLTEDFVVDNSKIIKAVNKQMPLTIKEGIMLTATSFKA
ncbi:MAG: NAD-dependent epimerase/dehydratase family protein [Mucilaginibacter sp.]|nr:NAD-dependent epimerase/dehydratase family protein [Mucilaginibacter sp.]